MGSLPAENANDRAEQTVQRLTGRASRHSPCADRTLEARCIAKGKSGPDAEVSENAVKSNYVWRVLGNDSTTIETTLMEVQPDGLSLCL